MKIAICGSDVLFDMSLEKAIKSALEDHTVEPISPLKEKIEQLEDKYIEIILPPVVQMQKESKNKDKFGKFIKRKFR